MDRIIDAKGVPCPQPVIKTKQALKEMKEGTLTVLVDNEIAVQNVMKLGTYLKMSPSSEKKAEGEYEVILHVTEQEAAKTEESKTDTETDTICAPDNRKKGLIAVIASDQMGSGSEELGRALMKGFIYALTQLEQLPETVILYNGGARLSTETSESIDDLKSLEAQGTEILTCGTCLNFYGLSDKLKVGSVTNMYEIAEHLAAASSVMRP